MEKAFEPDFFGGVHVSRTQQPNNDRWPRKALAPLTSTGNKTTRFLLVGVF